VRLREHGSELIEVADNGTGIDEANFNSLGTRRMAAFALAALPLTLPPGPSAAFGGASRPQAPHQQANRV